MVAFEYCPACGERSFEKQSEKSYQCNECRFLFFVNAAAAVALILECDSEILFTLRASDPCKGMLDLPGGFVDHNETAENALKRELTEELELTGLKAEYIISYPNIYPYAGYTYQTVDLFYHVSVSNKPQMTARDDVAGFQWINLSKIPMQDVAFASVKNALRYYLDNLSDG